MPTAVIPAIAAMLCGPAGDASPQAPAAVRRAVEAVWLRQEQVTWRRAADSPTALSGVLERGRRMIADFQRMGAVEAAGEAAGHLAAVRAADPGAGADEKARKARLALYLRARRALRRLAFRSPHLDFGELLLVRRHHPAWGHQCSHRVGEAQRPGADLCVLSPLSPDGKVRSLIAGTLRPGGIGRPDLSFDARRFVFP